MKKYLKGLMYLLVLIVGVFALTGCGENSSLSNMESSSSNNVESTSNSKESNEIVKVTSNDMIKIDGLYLNNEYTDEDDLKQIVLFYTLNAGEENIDISSSKFRLKINKNEYSPVDDANTPNLTQYYYSNIIEKVYVGKSLKVAEIFKVPDGDLVSGKEITLISFEDYAKGIKLSTDDIKKMDNLTAISLDVDKDYATQKQEEEKEKLTDADETTANQVKNDLNGYYFDIPAYVGQAYTNYKLEFEAPNIFTVTATIAGHSISNTGTYRVTKGYIVLHYDTDGKDVNTPYRYENGEITIDSPFYSNGSDTIF